MTALANYDAACAALAKASRVDEVKRVKDQAAWLEMYARQAKNKKLEAQAGVLRIRAIRRIGQMIAEQRAHTGLNKGGRPGKPGSKTDPVSRLPTLAEAGIDKKLADLSRKMAAVPAKEFQSICDDYTERVAVAGERFSIRLADVAERKGKRQARYSQMKEPGPLPSKRYAVIYADPATKFKSGDSDRSTENKYPTLDFDQLAAIDVPSIADRDCSFYCWTTVPWLAMTIEIAEKRWGFKYKSAAFWDKVVPGTGFWFRNQDEVLLVFARGEPQCPHASVRVSSHYSEKKTEHSRKPDYFAEVIERYHPKATKVELFRRGKARPGWDAWGNEADDDFDPKERVEDEKLLSKMQGDVRSLTKAYINALAKFDEYVRARDRKKVQVAGRLLRLLQIKAHGSYVSQPIQLTVAGSESEILRSRSAARPGRFPLWRQRGVFFVKSNIVSAYCMHDELGDFHFFAAGPQPFVSETGYLRVESPPILGTSVADAAERLLAEAIKSDRTPSGKLIERVALPKPETWYRLPRDGHKPVRKGGAKARAA